MKKMFLVCFFVRSGKKSGYVCAGVSTQKSLIKLSGYVCAGVCTQKSLIKDYSET